MTERLTPSQVRMMDAIAQAERLAQQNPSLHAAIYRRHEIEAGTDRYFVRLSNDTAPEGAELITTVSRKPPGMSGRHMGLVDAVQHVVDNLPAGVQLLDRAVIEFYPQRPYSSDRQVFAYQFISTEGRNVATWIPDVSMNGVGMQPGFDGRGRPWKPGGIEGEPTESIGWMIDAAKVKELEPGEGASEPFAAGWRRAESSLKNGASPEDDGPAGADEETFNGFVARMATERELRSQDAPMPEEPAPRAVRRPRP